MRTPLVGGLVAVSLGLMVVGMAARSWQVVLLALPSLVVLALGALSPPAPPDLACTRSVSRDRSQVDGLVDVEVRVTNRGADLDLLELFDSLPPELVLARGTNHVILRLDHGGVFSLRYTVTPTVKGEYRVGPMRARSLDPLALEAWDAVLEGSDRVVVAPRMEDLARAPVEPRRTRPWFGHVTSRSIGPGVEFWGVREYAAGDEMRRINWKASARLDRLHSNEYQGERSGDVVIILDARQESAVGSATWNAVELGVRAALGVADRVLASKNRVGLIVQRDVLDWVPPAFGRKQLYRILDHLVHVRAGGEWPFTFVAWILSRFFPRDALVVLISPLTDRTSLEAVLQLAARGYDVAVLSPSPLVIERRFLPDGPETEIAFRILSLERANLIAQLSRVAQVVDWDPTAPLALPLRRMRTSPRPW